MASAAMQKKPRIRPAGTGLQAQQKYVGNRARARLLDSYKQHAPPSNAPVPPPAARRKRGKKGSQPKWRVVPKQNNKPVARGPAIAPINKGKRVSAHGLASKV